MQRNTNFKKQLSTWHAYQRDLQYKNKLHQKWQQLMDEPKIKKIQTSACSGLPTDLSSNQATKVPLNVLEWTNSVLLGSCKSHITNWDYLAPFIANLQNENLWQKKLIPAIAPLALEPTEDPTSTVKSPSLYHITLLTYFYCWHRRVSLSFPRTLGWHNLFLPIRDMAHIGSYLRI